MRRVFRVVSALGAGASLVWGLARSLRKKSKPDEATPEWPPRPEPGAAAEPAAAAEPGAAAEPAAAAQPETAPEPAAPPQPEATPEELVLKGVVIEDPARLVSFVNEATDEAFHAAGIKGKALSVVLANRPFADAQALGSTSGIGRRTLQALNSAAE